MSKFDLGGRKALVTGGARGLGAGMATALSKAGAAVMIGDVLTDVGRETAKALATGGAKAAFVTLDVTDDAAGRPRFRRRSPNWAASTSS
jgi:3alpha(or 20beta)-hydroxysteroid dehydrogenase